MRLALNLDHLMRSPAEQRARHRAFLSRHLPSAPVTILRFKEPETAAAPATNAGPDVAALIDVQSEPTHPGPAIGADDAGRLRWMLAQYRMRRADRPHERPLVAARALGARAFGITIAQLLSTDRHKEISHPRQKIMAFTKLVTKKPWTEIARVFAKDHSTAFYATKKYEWLVRSVLEEERA